jgi:pimeloyl-ACP methyl ester carboxylesterase
MPSGIDRVDVPVPGGALATYRLGEAGPDAPTVVAVHGITANSHSWRAVARALGRRLGLVAPDLRGRGQSNGLPAPYGLAAHARGVVAVLDHLRLERAVLIGHSLGAYIVARVDPQQAVEAFLGPALARLRMTFRGRSEYHDWWRGHPAFAAGDVDDGDLIAYADHDLVGEAPVLRSSVSEAAVRGDAADRFEMGEPARRLTVPATLMCAPRGLLDEPNPVQPMPLVQQWVAEAPDRRWAVPVADVNHYTITLGRTGAAAVAAAALGALELAAAEHLL